MGSYREKTLVIMGRKARVCGAPITIPVDVEGAERILKRGCVLPTTENNVMLRFGENSLQVVDSQAFCTGLIDVRHVVELPRSVTFSRRHFSGKYDVAWGNKQETGDSELSRSVYIVNVQTGEVVARPLPSLNEQIADAFVGANGDQIVVVGATTGRLYGWSQWNEEILQVSIQSEWRRVDATAVDSTQLVDACSYGRFVTSAVMGNCFVYLRVRRHLRGSIVAEKWIFDVEARWAPVSFSSRQLGASASASDPVKELGLFITDTWKFAVLTVGSVLYHLQVDRDLRNTSVKRMVLDHQVLGGAWINQDSAFAMLLTTGQISIASVSDTGCFELLAITTSSTMSKRLSICALLGKAVSAALQLVCVEQEQIVVDFGSYCAVFKLEIVDEESSSNLSSGTVKSIELLSNVAFDRGRRQVIANLDKETSDFGDYIRELLEATSPPSSNELLGFARIALTRSQHVFEDSYFMLLCIVHQQLVGDSVNKGSSRDPIDCIGKSLKLMEVLVSFTLSMESTILRQVSSRLLSVLPGCTSKYDRKLYYRKEIAAISQQLRKSLSGVGESEDWWAFSTEVTAFLRVYFTTVRELLQEIGADSKQKLVEASQIIFLYQRIIEQEDGSAVVEPTANAERTNDSLFDRLKRLLTSYTMICCCLNVNGVMIDLEHLFSIVLQITLNRMEILCSFLKPWLRQVDDVRPVIPESNSAPIHMVQAVKYAFQTNTLQLLVNFCIASKSLMAHSCIKSLCNSADMCAKTTELETTPDDALHVDNLHLHACETYIGEAMAILHRISARRQFKHPNREAICSTGRLSFAIGHEFDVYCQTLSAELAKATKTCRVDTKISQLWEFSRLDQRLRARVICLISRIVWHLEAASGDFSSLVQQAFVMNLFNGRLGPFSEERGLQDCLTEVRAIINPVGSDLCFPRFREPKATHLRLSLRSQKIARSLVLVAWALWLREKAANCSRSAHIVKMSGNPDEKEPIGALAATCALHLNALHMGYGNNEELLSIQLSLLEEAATMNTSKTAAVIAWGFPAHKILTRHLKRYKRLRQVVLVKPMSTSLEESEQHCQRLQEHIRQVFQHIQDGWRISENPKLNDNSDIDMLVGCCCDPEVLQIMSALTNCPYEAVTIRPPYDINTAVHESPGGSADNVEIVLPNTDPEQVPTMMIEQLVEPQISESLISRDKVIALLQAQTRHLEEKIHAVKAMGRSRSLISLENIPDSRTLGTLPISAQGKKRATSERLPDKFDAAGETVVGLADVERMARISLQVRDLNRHRYSSANSEADKQTIQLVRPAQRHDSVRNALKLFRLRQENGGHTRSEQDDSNSGNENGTPNVGENLDTKAGHNTRTPAVVQRKSSRNQRISHIERRPPREPVHPLRLEYGADSASLKLLGRSSQQRNPSVKRKQFVHQELGRLQQVNSYPTKPRSIELTEVVQLKTVSAQTNDIIDAAIPPDFAADGTKELSSQQHEVGPEKSSPVTQECTEDKSVACCSVVTIFSQKGVGIQCRVTEDVPTNGARRIRGPAPLSIADKYPIWVDLDSADSVGARHQFKERKKFLQVARFGGPDATDHTTNNDAQLIMNSPSVSAVRVPLKVNSEDGSDENQSDGQQSPRLGNTLTQEVHTTEHVDDAMNVRYRASYREHYPIRERSSSRRSDDRDIASGINSLIDLRDNMERMTQRLRVLETCANSIDEEFKVSHKRLSRIGDTRSDSISSQTKVLEEINEVLEITEKTGSQPGDTMPRGGLLSKKALSDLDAAKKLLKTIEQLTSSTDDQ